MRIPLAMLLVALAVCSRSRPPVPAASGSSADGRRAETRAVSVSASGLRRLEARRFSGQHGNGALSVIFLAGAGQAISSGVDDTARIWDVASGAESKHFSGPRFHFQDIALSSDGHFSLTPAPDATLHYWTIDSGHDVHQFTGAKMGIGTVALSADGKLAAGAGQDTAIHVWEVASGKHLRQFPVNANVVRVAFEPDNSHLRSVEGDGRVCTWSIDRDRDRDKDKDNDKPLGCVAAGSDPVSQAAFAADGHKVLIGGRYGSLVLWDADRGTPLRKLQGSEADIVAVALAPSGNLALSGGADQTVRLWDLKTGTQIASTKSSGSYVSCVAFSADETLALFGSDDGAIMVWALQ